MREDLLTKQQQQAYDEAGKAGKRVPLFPVVIPAHCGERTVLIEMSSAKIETPGYIAKDEVKDGFFHVKMPHGAGISFLKSFIRMSFGTVSHQKLGSLQLVDSGRRIKTKDLVDGVKLRCTYISAYTKYGTSAKDNVTVMRRTKRPQRVEQPWDAVDYFSRGYVIDRDDADW